MTRRKADSVLWVLAVVTVIACLALLLYLGPYLIHYSEGW